MKTFNVLFIFILGSCSNTKKIEVSKTYMDTIYTITIIGTKEQKHFIDKAFKIVEENENKYFSIYKDTELNRINQKLRDCKDKEYLDFEISDKLSNILSESLKYYEATDKKFSVNFLNILKLWETSFSNNKVPSEADIQQTLNLIHKYPYDLPLKNKLHAKCKLSFGLGAIAKGFTLDELYTFFISNRINDFLIDAGGDLIISGSKFSKPWMTAVLDPSKKTRPSIVCKFKDQKISIVSSGSYFRYTEHNGKKYSHIIDVKKGKPSDSDIISISIISQNATLADAYATALYIDGFENVKYKFTYLSDKDIGVIISKTGSKNFMNNYAKKFCY